MGGEGGEGGKGVLTGAKGRSTVQDDEEGGAGARRSSTQLEVRGVLEWEGLGKKWGGLGKEWGVWAKNEGGLGKENIISIH